MHQLKRLCNLYIQIRTIYLKICHCLQLLNINVCTSIVSIFIIEGSSIITYIKH